MQHKSAATPRRTAEPSFRPAPGDWVALTLDQSKIIATCPLLGDLERKLHELGEDPQQVVYVRTPPDKDELVMTSADLDFRN